MPIVVGVSLRTAGKIYFFDPGTERYERGERVLVETARGLELGHVKLPPHEVGDDQIVPPLKCVLRRPSADDLARDAATRDRETCALDVCKRLVARLNLPMRLIDAQYTFDGAHLLIHFLADNRVDFRELVRELAHELRTRIELRQVGVRDEAKLLGGHGICGRHLCCASFLTNFVPVAINTAKEQGLALNPQKISGMCGRLMCCLSYEHECYKEVGKGLPRMNSHVVTPRGPGKVTKLNVLQRQVEVSFPDQPGPLWFAVTELTLPQPADATAPACGGCAAICEAPVASAGPADAPATVEPDEEGAAGEKTEARRRSRRRRRRKSDAPTGGEPASAAPTPAPASADAPRPARPQNDIPVTIPLGAAAPAEHARPLPEGQATAGRRRRRRRH